MPNDSPVSAASLFWFHCGRCGSLFQSQPGESEERTCSHCGSKPSLGLDATPAPASPGAFQTAVVEPHAGDRKRVTQRKHKSSYLVFKLAAIWILVLGGIVFGVRFIWHDQEAPASESTGFTPKKSGAYTQEDSDLINGAKEGIGKNFIGFISSTGAEQHNQFVFSPIATAGRMARFYNLNPVVKINPSGIVAKNTTIIHIPDRRAIEVDWAPSDGRMLDTAFYEENGEWRLDWDHYVRYSDYPWPLFLSDKGDSEGEFRLLARERLAEERRSTDTLSLILYAPRFGYGDTTGQQSPEFNVRRASPDGRLLEAAFKLQRAGKRPFDMKITGTNPEELIRVRLKVRRIDDGEARHFEITKVIACHWYSTDLPGVEVPREDAPAGQK